MRVPGLLLLMAALGAIAFVAFLREETRAFDDDTAYRLPNRQNADRGNPDPVTVIERRGNRERWRDPHPEERASSDGSPDRPSATPAYWIRDPITGGYRLSTSPPSAPQPQRYRRPQDVEVTLRHEGPGTSLPLTFIAISYRDFDPGLEPFDEHVSWKDDPLALGESRVFEKKIPSGTMAFAIYWSDTAGNSGFSRKGAEFRSGTAEDKVTWVLNSTNCELFDRPSIEPESRSPVLLVLLIGATLAFFARLSVTRRSTANAAGTQHGSREAQADGLTESAEPRVRSSGAEPRMSPEREALLADRTTGDFAIEEDGASPR